MPICIAANELGIRVVSCIYSWDNIPKASIGVLADEYLVWSDLMKKEFQLLYPEIEEKNIIVTGTPQFEFYNDDSLKQNREVFAAHHNLDIDKKWICFSGDDVKTSPYDPTYLEDVASSIKHMELNAQILFRRCPVDFSGRYDKILLKYHDVIKVIDPVWVKHTDNWGAVFPKKEDVSLLVNMVHHCDLVLNLGSTMAHDFAIYDKPCLYFNYDPLIDKNRSVKDVYNFQHFKSMKDLDAVGWINSKNDIGVIIYKALKKPNEIGKERKKWLALIVNNPLGNASSLIAKHLIS
jgi:hypothetical protein